MNADFFEKIYVKLQEEGEQSQEEPPKQTFGQKAGEIARKGANFALNGGPLGMAAERLTRPGAPLNKSGDNSIANAVNNFTSKDRSWGEVGGAVAGRAAIAAGAVAAPILAKYGLQLAGDKLNSLMGELGNVFNKDGGNDQQIKLRVQKLEQTADTNLQFDIKNILQKAKAIESKYAKSVINVCSPLATRNDNIVQ